MSGLEERFTLPPWVGPATRVGVGGGSQSASRPDVGLISADGCRAGTAKQSAESLFAPSAFAPWASTLASAGSDVARTGARDVWHAARLPSIRPRPRAG